MKQEKIDSLIYHHKYIANLAFSHIFNISTTEQLEV